MLSAYGAAGVVCGLVGFSVAGRNAEAVRDVLARRPRRINVYVSWRPSTLLDIRQLGLNGFVRASVHYYNLSEGLEECGTAIHDLVSVERTWLWSVDKAEP
jgi:hypothetical protein